MSVQTTPCNWPVNYSECGEGALADLEDEQRAVYEEMAATFLWIWTEAKFGLCDITLRPCKKDCPESGGLFWASPSQWMPVLVGGEWFNISCGACRQACPCDKPSLRLPGPIDSVTEVTIDGVVLPLTDVRVENTNILVRLDGEKWPQCGLEVTYQRGIPVPAGGQVAAGLLAMEFYKAACKDNSCALPQRMKQITRQGVTVTLIDDFKDIDEGRTGIWLIDSWVASVTKAKRPGGSVRSPDFKMSSARRTTWAAP